MRRFFFVLGILLILPTVAFAQTPTSGLIPATGNLGAGCNFVTGNIGFACIPLYIGYVIRAILPLAGVLFLLSIIFSGYKYMLGSISSEGVEAGKKRLMASIIGFVVVILSYLIVDTIIEALT